MGDRANVFVINRGTLEDPKEGVWLYSHWGGHGLPATLQVALERGKGRWGDTPYLTRILFCDLIRGDCDGLTGYGISTYITDNEHPVLVVDCERQRVGVAPSPSYEERGRNGAYVPRPARTWTFREFCVLTLKPDDSPRALLGGDE
jgi:hypothetical protein